MITRKYFDTMSQMNTYIYQNSIQIEDIFNVESCLDGSGFYLYYCE